MSTTSSTSANGAPSGGGAVTISGLSFGTAGPTATASLTTADACGSSAWTSATTVACAPQAYGGSGEARAAVSVSGVVGTLTGQFSFDGTETASGHFSAALFVLPTPQSSPSVCSVHDRVSHRSLHRLASMPAPCASVGSPPNIAFTAGVSFTISGLAFGSSAFTPTASLGAEDACSSTAWTSVTTVACAPSAYSGSSVRVAVSVNAVVGTLTGQFSFDGTLARCAHDFASCGAQ